MEVNYIVVGQQECVGKYVMLNKLVDKNPTIIRRISDEPSQERRYKKENKNENIVTSMKKYKHSPFLNKF